MYIKSPFNYIGGKHKLLDQIIPYFPEDIGVFLDLFGGGGNVGVNVDANKIIINDMNYKIIEFFKYLQNTKIEKVLSEIDSIINDYKLTKTNSDGFLKLRKEYNMNPHPIKLYVLISFSYNYQFRFNNSMEYNSSFGKNRSSFNKNMKNRLMLFTSKIQQENIEFNSYLFEHYDYKTLKEKDFVYCDPPYSITTGNYNDGNRGFKNWSSESDKILIDILDRLNDRGIRWAMSNVLKHKGATNHQLLKWSERYNIVDINQNYSNSSYNTKKGSSREVLIFNYDI